MASVYKSSLPGASPGGDGVATHGKLRMIVKKAFQDTELALIEWEEAHEHSCAVMDALTNAASRARDFEAAEGSLGVISSKFPGAERLLRVRLIQSMDRLLSALQTDIKLFEATCTKVEKIYESVLKDQADMQVGAFSSRVLAWCDLPKRSM
jgi:hypothetical protein